MATGVAIISFSAIFVGLSEASPVTAAFFRAAYALPVLLVMQLLSGRSSGRTSRQRWLAFGAGIAFAADLAAWHVAIELIGAGLATVVGSVHVVTTMIAGWALLNQRPTRLAVLLTPLVLIGVVLISGFGSSDAQGESPVLGVFFGVLTAVLYTTYLLLLRQAGTEGASPVESLLEATAGAAVGALVLAPLDPAFSLVPSWPSHGWLLLLALGAQVIGWLLINGSLPHLEAWETSLLLVLQPAGTILWAYLIFQEVFSASQWVGLVMVVIGVTAVTVSRARSETVEPLAPDAPPGRRAAAPPGGLE
jgi:drug/metabolite transporter (DMT)-like permease